MSDSDYDHSIIVSHQVKEFRSSLEKLFFTFTRYNLRDVSIVNRDDLALWQLKDIEVQISKLLQIKSSEENEKDLKLLLDEVIRAQETLNNIEKIQNLWRSVDERLKDPKLSELHKEELKLSEDLAAEFQKHLEVFIVNPGVWKNTTNEELHASLKKIQESFSSINEQIYPNFDEKRTKYPKFYLFSYEDLSYIFEDTTSLDAAVSKVLDQISKLSYSEDGNHITGVYSKDKEHIKFVEHLNKEKISRDEIFAEIEAKLKESLRKFVHEGIKTIFEEKIERHTWARTQLSQVALTVSHVYWTRTVENAITKIKDEPEGLKKVLEHHEKYVESLIAIIQEDISPLETRIIQSLIAEGIRNRDIIDELIKENVQSLKEWTWQQQIRAYWDEEKNQVYFKLLGKDFVYGYNLVTLPKYPRTPETDRGWLTISTALADNIGAALVGPTGTGKTESAYELARKFGYNWIIIDCSNCGLDDVSKEIFHRSLQATAQNDIWAIIDEVNRLPVDVANDVTPYFVSLYKALQNGAKEVIVGDKTIKLSKHSGILLTINPGYGGQFTVPDSWKPYFRPCKMFIPDYQNIVEVALAKQGFSKFKELSSKLVKFFQTASETLKDYQYIELRTRKMLSTVKRAGELLRKHKDLSSEAVIAKSILSFTGPSLTTEQEKHLKGWINELFGDLKVEELVIKEPELSEAIKKIIEKLGFKPSEKLIYKTLQLFELINLKNGVILTGETGSGKSTLIKILVQSLNELVKEGSKDTRLKNTEVDIIKDPQNLSSSELYGATDYLTNQWNDGIFTKLLKKFKSLDENLHKWIVFDGELSVLWIENLNTLFVEDEESLFWLNSKESIKGDPSIRFILETKSVENCSPSFLSRVGVLHLSKADLE